MTHTATYSPDDNKLRLRSSTRLDAETYARVTAAGFRFAPAQHLFVAPAWSPAREDLLIALCGEIGDEDTTLVDRAEQRAERYSGFGGRREAEAQSARAAVAAVADHIPFGQPILVGHHSERHARRDAERIHSGMSRAVKLWDTAAYWSRRAEGALRHAKYKERPDVRARRIRKLESERRKTARSKAEGEQFVRLWSVPGLTREQAEVIADRFHAHYEFPLDKYPRDAPASQYEGLMSLWGALREGIITPEQARELALTSSAAAIASAERWLAHYDNRLAYERAMLEEQGGTVADRTVAEQGGACRCWTSPPGGWSYIRKVNKVTVTVHYSLGNGGRTFRRTIPFDKLVAVMSADAVAAAREEGRLSESSDGSGFHLRPPVAETEDGLPLLAAAVTPGAGAEHSRAA